MIRCPAWALLAIGCHATIPSGRYVCDVDGDCPPGMSCVGAVCETSAHDAGPRDGGRDAAPPVDAGHDGGAPDAGMCMSYGLPLVADTSLSNMFSCNGTINYGGALFVNLGSASGAGLLRFATVPELTGATIHSATLTLTRATVCDGSACPAGPGQLCVQLARNDWTEGTVANASGADWCRRQLPATLWDDCPTPDMTGRGCGAQTPNSQLETVCADVTGTEAVLEMPLDPARIEAAIAFWGSDAITLRIAGAAWVAISREGGAPAQLQLELCH